MQEVELLRSWDKSANLSWGLDTESWVRKNFLWSMHWVSWKCSPASLSLSFHFSKAHSALYHICSTIIFTSPHPQTFLLTLFPHSTFCCWESFSGVFEFGVSVAGESLRSFPPFLNCSTVCIFKQLGGRSPQICTVYLCVTLKNQIINPCSNANSLITRLVCVPTTTKTILGHLPDLL